MASWRELRCGVCGAPRIAIDDAQLIACEFCGAVYDTSARHWFDAARQTEALARAHAATFWASKAAGRFARLGEELARATPTADDRTFLEVRGSGRSGHAHRSAGRRLVR